MYTLVVERITKKNNQMQEKSYFVYILASQRNSTIYIGVTNDIVRRVSEHKAGKIRCFTQKYQVNKLVWFAENNSIHEAIFQEKRMKKWKREDKLKLIEKTNPNWQDLYIDLLD